MFLEQKWRESRKTYAKHRYRYNIIFTFGKELGAVDDVIMHNADLFQEIIFVNH